MTNVMSLSDMQSISRIFNGGFNWLTFVRSLNIPETNITRNEKNYIKGSWIDGRELDFNSASEMRVFSEYLYEFERILDKSNLTIMDVGCSVGGLRIQLRGDGKKFKFIGLDLNKNRIDYGNKIIEMYPEFKICTDIYEVGDVVNFVEKKKKNVDVFYMYEPLLCRFNPSTQKIHKDFLTHLSKNYKGSLVYHIDAGGRKFFDKNRFLYIPIINKKSYANVYLIK